MISDKKIYLLEAVVYGLLIGIWFLLLFPRVFTDKEIIAPADLAYFYTPYNTNNPLHIKPAHYVLSDQFDEIIPNLYQQHDVLRHGQIPAYTDKIQNGTANFWVIKHEGQLLPLIALTLILGFPVGWTAFLILRVVAGGYFMLRYLRYLNISFIPALFGTVVFACSSVCVQNFGITLATQYVMIPIGLYAVEKIIRERSKLWIFLFPVIVEQMIVAGYPATSSYVLFIWGCYIIYRTLQFFDDILGNFLLFFLLGALSLALCAPAIFASIDFFSQFDWAYRNNYWASGVPRNWLITWLLPFYFGDPTINSWIRYAVYIGILPLLVAFVTFFNPRFNGIKWFFLLMFLWFFSVSYNLFNILDFYKFIPVFNSSMPNTNTLVLPFFTAIFVALGFEEIYLGRVSIIRFLSILMVVVSVILYLAQGENLMSRPEIPGFSQHLQAQILVLIFSVAAVAIFCWQPRSLFSAAFVLTVIMYDLYGVAQGWNRSVPRAAFYPETPGERFLKQNVGTSKIFMLEKEFIANTPQIYSLPTIGGRGFFNTRTKLLYGALWKDAFKTTPTQIFFPANSGTKIFATIFDALGIKYLLTPPRVNPHEMYARGFAYQQSDWNSFVSLTAENPVSQTFKTDNGYKSLTLTLPIAAASIPAPEQMVIEISSDGTAISKTSAQVEPGGGSSITAEFSDLSLEAGKLYRMEIKLSGPGEVQFSWAKDTDRIPSGTAFHGQEALPGDLKFELFAEQSAPAGMEEKFKLVYDKDLRVWENTKVFDRAWVVHRIEFIDDQEFADSANQDKLQLADTAYFPKDASEDKNLKPFAESKDHTRDSVTVEKIEDMRQIYAAKLSKPGLLIVSDNYDYGWVAYVNGTKTQIRRANLNMRAIVLPQGEYKIELRYAPDFLMFGYILAAIGAFVLLALTFLVQPIPVYGQGFRPDFSEPQ